MNRSHAATGGGSDPLVHGNVAPGAAPSGAGRASARAAEIGDLAPVMAR